MTLHLLLGGARSGKSTRALALGAAGPAPHLFLATAEAGDPEFAGRIARHRAERAPFWRTVEAPRAAAAVIAAAGSGTLLLDCLTLWLTNQMLAGADLEAETEHLLGAMTAFRGLVLAVSNEVGQGVVPETALGRAFRDAQGRLNQRVAAEADRVELMVAGLPLAVKGADLKAPPGR